MLWRQRNQKDSYITITGDSEFVGARDEEIIHDDIGLHWRKPWVLSNRSSEKDLSRKKLNVPSWISRG